MRQDDSVFFFTLIDFLVQVLFFGLAFYSVAAYNDKKAMRQIVKVEVSEARRIQDWTWSKSISHLATSLAPLEKPRDNFHEWAEFISAHDLQNVKLTFDFVEKNGGLESLGRAVRALGQPSCLDADRERNSVTAVAGFLLFDSEILVQQLSPMFAEVDGLLGTRTRVGEVLPLDNFRARYKRLPSLRSDCRYFVNVREETPLKAARDAVESAFLLASRR